MIGDKYQVFYHENGMVPYGSPVDNWETAKALRWNANPKTRVVWVMRSNPSLNLRPGRYGYALRRTKHEIVT